MPTWKAKHSHKPNPLSEHLLPCYLHFHFTLSPSGYLSSKVCWIKFGFHLYPAREITLSICRKEQKWIQSGFPCISVLQPWLSLLALGGIISPFVKNQWLDLWYYLAWWWQCRDQLLLHQFGNRFRYKRVFLKPAFFYLFPFKTTLCFLKHPLQILAKETHVHNLPL